MGSTGISFDGFESKKSSVHLSKIFEFAYTNYRSLIPEDRICSERSPTRTWLGSGKTYDKTPKSTTLLSSLTRGRWVESSSSLTWSYSLCTAASYIVLPTTSAYGLPGKQCHNSGDMSYAYLDLKVCRNWSVITNGDTRMTGVFGLVDSGMRPR